jgi:hypothetical protein
MPNENLNENEIKAIFSLLTTETGRKEQLLNSLKDFYNKNPRQVYALAAEYFGVLPPELAKLFKENQNNLQADINKYLNLKNPSLLEGLILLAKIINPKSKKEEILELFNLAGEEFDKVMDSSFEVSQKAQVLQIFFFKTLGFKLEKIKNPNLFNLPEIFKNLKTTPFVMAVLYLIFIYPYEVKADIFEAENKIIVRLRDSFSLEPVYIDIIQKGHFVSEEECDMYAAGNFIKWDSKNIKFFTKGEIFKKLLAELAFSSKGYEFLSIYLHK